MIMLLVILFFTFLFYYLACYSNFISEKKTLFIVGFVVSAIVLRQQLTPDFSNDYQLYFNFKIFHRPTSFLSCLVNEPYLYLVYAFFDFFLNTKKDIFLAMYWFNFLIAMTFFVWLITRNDVEMWKKMILFVCYYFLLAFAVLRNGPAYILFALYFYFSFRNKKFNWVLITPFIHISSSLLLVTFFHKIKNYFTIVLFVLLVSVILYFIMYPFISELNAFQSILYKIEFYSRGMEAVGFMHIVFFLFILLLVGLGGYFYKREMLHPIIVTTLFFYVLTFFINPAVAYRFSPFVIFSLLLFPFEQIKSDIVLRILNLSTILFFPFFVYAMFKCHKTDEFIALFIGY